MEDEHSVLSLRPGTGETDVVAPFPVVVFDGDAAGLDGLVDVVVDRGGLAAAEVRGAPDEQAASVTPTTTRTVGGTVVVNGRLRGVPAEFIVPALEPMRHRPVGRPGNGG